MKYYGLTQTSKFTYLVILIATLVWARNVQLILDLPSVSRGPMEPDEFSREEEHLNRDLPAADAAILNIGHDPFQQSEPRSLESAAATVSGPKPTINDFDWSARELVGIVNNTALIREKGGETWLLTNQDSLNAGGLVRILPDSVEIQHNERSIVLRLNR